MEQFGRLDILVNNAATVPYGGPLLEADLAAWNTPWTSICGPPFC